MDAIFNDLEIDERSLAAPPPEYWEVLRQSRHDRSGVSIGAISRGMAYHRAMLNLKMQLENWTRTLYEMHREIFDFDIVLCPTEGITFLHYDDKLLSRWNMLLHALAGSRFWGSLHIESIELPQVLLGELAKALTAREKFIPANPGSTHSISLRNNGFGPESALAMSQVLEQGYLHSLSVTDNDLCSSKAAFQLSKTLASRVVDPNDASAKHRHLESLDLSRSWLGMNARCLSSVLSSCVNLKVLSLNGIALQSRGNRSRGIDVIGEFLESNPMLVELELCSNQLQDNAAALLAAALGTNTHLRRLALGHHSFSDAASVFFRKAIFDDSSLNSIIDCNHTCRVYGVSEEIRKLQSPKKMKKFRALCKDATESNAALNYRLLDDISAELMPRVLAWSRSVPKSISKPLSLVFDILRSWKLPQLFLGRHQPEEVKLCLREMISIVSKSEGDYNQSFHQASLPPKKATEYDMVLPKSGSNGLLINVGEILVCGEVKTAFIGYRRSPVDGSKGPSQLFTRIVYRDVINAVNGIQTYDKSFKEVVKMIKESHSFVHIRFESESTLTRVWLCEALKEVKMKWEVAFDKSVELQKQKSCAVEEYSKLVGENWITGAGILTEEDRIRRTCNDVLQELKDRVSIRLPTERSSLVIDAHANGQEEKFLLSGKEEAGNDTEIVSTVLGRMIDSVERRELARKREEVHEADLRLSEAERNKREAWAQMNEHLATAKRRWPHHYDHLDCDQQSKKQRT